MPVRGKYLGEPGLSTLGETAMGQACSQVGFKLGMSLVVYELDVQSYGLVQYRYGLTKLTFVAQCNAALHEAMGRFARRILALFVRHDL